MPESTSASLCRIRVQLPDRIADLAVPSDIPVADLLPALVGYLATEAQENSVDHSGWVLQRLGGAPLDEDHTLDSLELRDGETLFLRPSAETLPEAHFDDLVDGIGAALERQGGAWYPAASKRLLLAVGLLLLAAALTVLLLPGAPGSPRAAGALVCGVVALAGGLVAGRAVGDRTAATAYGLACLPFFGVAGWSLAAGPTTGQLAAQTQAADLLSAGAAVAGAAALALALTGGLAPVLASAGVVGVALALLGLVATTADVTLGQSAGVVAVLAVLLGAFVPVLSFRLAGLRMPPLPTNAQQLQEGIEPHPSEHVTASSAVADSWMSALYAAIGVVCGGTLVLVSTEGTLASGIASAVFTLLLLLHGGRLGSVAQRLALVLPGTLAATALLVRVAMSQPPSGRAVLVAVVLLAAGGATVASWTVPGRRMVPYWGRAGEILHSLCAVAVLPLALWVLGVYGQLHQMFG
jgi:type VII secretion integral membrane protein EccD